MEPLEIREFRSRIAKAVRKLREEEGISAQFLAKVLGVTQPTISRIENGTTSIASEKLCFLARSFNRPLSYFVGEKSPLLYNENDILRAGLVFYGARHLKSKRTINVLEYYRTYTDFLNAALAEVDDPRFAVALATTLYQQAKTNKLKITKILTTVQNERLIANLKALITIIKGAGSYIKRPSSEKERVLKILSQIEQELPPHIHDTKSIEQAIIPGYLAEFINESITYE